MNCGAGLSSVERNEQRMKRKAESEPNPGKGAPKTVDAYFAGLAEPAHSMLMQIRATIRAGLPKEATETVSYRMPAFKLKKVVVWFAAFKDHCSLFPTAAVIEAFKEELESKGITTSKGTVHFPLGKPLPTALIKRLVKARLERS
jgi:uncharacterized protein YdhG (YjbR/CyaY superfamily)